MTQQNPYLQGNLDRKMTSEEFTEVIAAISEGKYSWACVLILKIAGYNPLHYIPYRTYNRLVKDNLNAQKNRNQQAAARSREANRPTQAIEDLDHLEMANQTQIRGGSFQRIFNPFRNLRI